MAVGRVPSSTAAASILREIFGGVAAGFAFRLWDGTVVALGESPPRFTVVVHAPQTFRRLIRDPSPLHFAEAFVEGAIDIEGDLFAAMRIANSIEEIRVSTLDRLRIAAALLRG